ncbi:MAG TPA: WecB/TagA/CpsF family glycosyltransferase [Chitinophagales bacterium]|nr:WecB/TagA/CpsF family glycosyltransferase [Chitinophagales bacterium]
MLSFKENVSKLKFLNSRNIDEVTDILLSEWQNNKYLIVHFMYYASLELIRKDEIYAQTMSISDYVLVDGIGMQLYFKWALDEKMNNLNGTDLSPVLIDKLYKKNIPIVFYGTTKEQISACNANLSRQYGQSILSYYQDGYSKLDWSQVKPNSVLFVGKGTPLQEIWTSENFQQIKYNNIFVITVGGYFDFLSGLYIRAPKLIRTLKLEWLWRTMLHPTRHYQKRLRDTTIIFRPFLDRWANVKPYFNIINK